MGMQAQNCAVGCVLLTEQIYKTADDAERHIYCSAIAVSACYRDAEYHERCKNTLALTTALNNWEGSQVVSNSRCLPGGDVHGQLALCKRLECIFGFSALLLGQQYRLSPDDYCSG